MISVYRVINNLVDLLKLVDGFIRKVRAIFVSFHFSLNRFNNFWMLQRWTGVLIFHINNPPIESKTSLFLRVKKFFSTCNLLDF